MLRAAIIEEKSPRQSAILPLRWWLVLARTRWKARWRHAFPNRPTRCLRICAGKLEATVSTNLSVLGNAFEVDRKLSIWRQPHHRLYDCGGAGIRGLRACGDLKRG